MTLIFPGSTAADIFLLGHIIDAFASFGQYDPSKHFYEVSIIKATQLALTIEKVLEKSATIQTMKGDQQLLKDEQHRQGATIQVLKDEQHRQGVILEDIQGQVQTIAEAITPLLSNSEAMPQVKSTLKSQSQDITMTQQTLKRHIEDPNAHNTIRTS